MGSRGGGIYGRSEKKGVIGKWRKVIGSEAGLKPPLKSGGESKNTPRHLYKCAGVMEETKVGETLQATQKK